MSNSTYTYVAYIRTSQEKLWAALTSAEIIKQYWFGMTVEGDWTVGSTWRFSYDGNLMDSGEILENVPQKRLVRSWINEWKGEFKIEGSSICTYELESAGSAVKLTVTHSIGHPNSKFVDALSEGWPMCISNLKSLLETGQVALDNHPGHEE